MGTQLLDGFAVCGQDFVTTQT